MRKRKNTNLETRRQFDLDETSRKKFDTLGTVTGSPTHSETLKKLITISSYVFERIKRGDKTLDLEHLDSLYFTYRGREEING